MYTLLDDDVTFCNWTRLCDAARKRRATILFRLGPSRVYLLLEIEARAFMANKGTGGSGNALSLGLNEPSLRGVKRREMSHCGELRTGIFISRRSRWMGRECDIEMTRREVHRFVTVRDMSRCIGYWAFFVSKSIRLRISSCDLSSRNTAVN